MLDQTLTNFSVENLEHNADGVDLKSNIVDEMFKIEEVEQIHYEKKINFAS